MIHRKKGQITKKRVAKKCEYLCVLTDCKSTVPRGFAAVLNRKPAFIGAVNQFFSVRSKNRKPGKAGQVAMIDRVIFMNTQYFPGKSTKKFDSEEKRERWFFECMMEIATINKTRKEINPVNSIGFHNLPENYVKILQSIEKVLDFDVYLYEYDPEDSSEEDEASDSSSDTDADTDLSESGAVIGTEVKADGGDEVKVDGGDEVKVDAETMQNKTE